MMYWGDHGWGMGFGWIFMIIFWALVIFGVVSAVRSYSKGSGTFQSDDPLQILKRRYAKGEISREEFERMKNDLKKE